MNWLRNPFLGRTSAPIRKNVRLQVERLEDRWAPAIVLTPTTLLNWEVNKPGYSQTLAVTGGTGADTFSFTGGTLPTGLNLSTAGVLSGTPTIAGAYNFQITATDSVLATGSAIYTVTINPALAISTTAPLSAGTVNFAYSQTISATGGTGTDIYSLTAGALPTGVNLTTAGVLAGTPTTAGPFSFTITATDAIGATASQAYTVTINPALTLTPTALANWTLNKTGYSQTISAAGADSFAVTTGTLPTGLSLNAATGTITGTPTKAVSADAFTITATDSATGADGAQAYTITINPAITLTPTTLPGWDVNQSGYSQQISVTGGTGADKIAVTGGTLPTGLTFTDNGNGTATLAGKPTTVAAYSFQVTATDSIGATGATTYTVTIAATLAISTASPLPTATASVAYSQTIATTGGTGTLVFSYTGTLPPGVPLSAAGVLSGTPTTAGPYSFTIVATDTLGVTVSKAFTLAVDAAPTTPVPVGTTPTQIRQAYGFNQISFGGVAGDGTGTTIAIVDAYDDPNIASDLHQFDLAFGLTDPTFRKVSQTGSTTSLPPTDPAGAGSANSNFEAEEALDVEWAHAIAPKASILLVEATDSTDTNLFAAVAFAAKQPGVVAVSMSFGVAEFSGETADNSIFQTPAGHKGVTFVAASGDAGAPPQYPATSPNVLSVGGTTLNLDAAGNILSESGWSGSGGGVSVYEAKPTYQKGVVTQSTVKRTTPDVAYDSDPNTGFPVYDSYNDGTTNPWAEVGGTSDAAPQWAALLAIADQGRIHAGLTPLNGPTQTLPKIYALPATDFHDITTGTSTGKPNYSARPGYDLVTGRGTPYANLIVSGLVGPPVITSASSAVFTAGVAGSFQVTAVGTPPVSYELLGAIPSWLSINLSTGLLVGTPPVSAPNSQETLTFTIEALDGNMLDGAQTFKLTVFGPRRRGSA